MSRLALVPLLYAALFVIVTWPLAADPAGQVVARNGDAFFDMLMFWYAGTQGLFQGTVTSLFYPWGVGLGPEQGHWLVPYLSVPAQWVMPLPLAYNLVCLAFFAGTGSAVYALARQCGAEREGALLAGALVVLSPSYLTELAIGIPENLALMWLALFLLFGLRLRDRRDAVLCGLCFSLAWLSSWYLGWFALLCIPFIPFRRLAVVAALVAALVLAVPFALAVKSPRVSGPSHPYDAARAASLAHGREPGGTDRVPEVSEDEGTLRALTGSVDFSALLARFRPAPLRDVVPGLLLLALAAYGWWISGSAARRWVVLGAVFLGLSMGPWLIWGGRAVAPLPTEWLYAQVGFLSQIRPVRYLLPATLALAVAAAFSLPMLRAQGGRAALLALVVALQYVEVSAVHVGAYRVTLASADVPAWYGAIRGGSGAIVEMPLTPYDLALGRKMYYQTAHQRPLLNYNFITADSRERLLQEGRRNALLGLLLGLPASPTRSDADALAGMGFQYVVLHGEVEAPHGEPGRAFLYSPRMFQILRGLYGDPSMPGDGLQVFDMASRQGVTGTLHSPTPDQFHAERSRLLCTLPWSGHPEGEVQAWMRGPGRLLAVHAGTVLATGASGDGRWQWNRLPLSLRADCASCPGVELRLETTAPVEVSQVALFRRGAEKRPEGTAGEDRTTPTTP